MNRRSLSVRGLRAATALAASLIGLSGITPANAQFVVTNLVSNGAVPAVTTDPNLVNPWGIASSPTGPFWISDNATGVSTLYNTGGTKIPLTVTIPPPVGSNGTAAPTGIVFNGSAGNFQVSSNGRTGTAAFIFSTEDGTISGWSPSVNFTQAILARDNSALGSGAVYKGLAIASTSNGNFIYASDFRNGLVEQFDSNYNLVRSFTDPSVQPGYAPFGIQTLGDHLFVTYAVQNATKHDDVAGPGNGYVDEFNFDGTFFKRLVSQGGEVNSPWGLDIAPASFNQFAGRLLVGNFGDGTISVFDQNDGDFLGKLFGTDGNPLEIPDLWALTNGVGGAGGDPNKVYFTAGLADEANGLFGSIAPVPEPSSWAMMLVGFGAMGLGLRRRAFRSALAQAA